MPSTCSAISTLSDSVKSVRSRPDVRNAGSSDTSVKINPICTVRRRSFPSANGFVSRSSPASMGSSRGRSSHRFIIRFLPYPNVARPAVMALTKVCAKSPSATLTMENATSEALKQKPRCPRATEYTAPGTGLR